MTKQIAILAGTSDGAYIYTSDHDRCNWQVEGPFLGGHEVYSILGDRQDGRRLLAGISGNSIGPGIQVSEDLGRSWRSVFQGPCYPPETGFALERIWHLAPGHSTQPDVVFAGAEEAGLFASQDRGQTWVEMNGLTNHPTRPEWFPGAGGMCLNTVLIHPSNPQRMWVSMSSVGVFRTDDAGETWKACNKGLSRAKDGEEEPEVGYCAHKITLDPYNHDVLYMQDHGGVFKSVNGADSWFPIEDGLPPERISREPAPPFGFPITVSPSGDVFVMPLENCGQTKARGGKTQVFRLQNSDTSWLPVGTVSSANQTSVTVLRDGMVIDALEPYGAYFGTTSGELFCSLDRGESWERLPGQLPRILTVKTWMVE